MYFVFQSIYWGDKAIYGLEVENMLCFGIEVPKNVTELVENFIHPRYEIYYMHDFRRPDLGLYCDIL